IIYNSRTNLYIDAIVKLPTSSDCPSPFRSVAVRFETLIADIRFAGVRCCWYMFFIRASTAARSDSVGGRRETGRLPSVPDDVARAMTLPPKRAEVVVVTWAWMLLQPTLHLSTRTVPASPPPKIKR